jgi:hypothetical protein
VNGVFEESEIGMENITFVMIDKFEPPPIGKSNDEDFDPTVHLEI